MNNLFFEDSIGMVSDWRKSGPVWEIRFGTLQGCETNNFFAAGRCISLIGDAWEITRCIPCSGLTEEAAGNAAALFGTGKREKLCGNVQKSMTANGNILHWEEE